MSRHLLSREGQKNRRTLFVSLPPPTAPPKPDPDDLQAICRALESVASAGHSDELIEALAALHEVTTEAEHGEDPMRAPDTQPVEQYIITGVLPGTGLRQTA